VKKHLFLLLSSLVLLALLPTLILRILETRLLPPKKINLQTIQEKIISSEVTYDCQIKVKTDKKEFFLPTNLDVEKIKCYQFVLSTVSPSGNFLAYEDISGGVDSMVWIYSLEEDARLQLDVLGTSAIKDILFDKDDRLIVLNGYDEEMSFRVYDIPGLFKGYPGNVDTRYNIFLDGDFMKYTKTHILPKGYDFNRLKVDEDLLYIYVPPGVSEEPLQKLELKGL
jgi:hypothetical protein